MFRRACTFVLLTVLAASAQQKQLTPHQQKLVHDAEGLADSVIANLRASLDLQLALKGTLLDDSRDRHNVEQAVYGFPRHVLFSDGVPPRLVSLELINGKLAPSIGDRTVEELSWLQWNYVYLRVATGENCYPADKDLEICKKLEDVYLDAPLRADSPQDVDRATRVLKDADEYLANYVRAHGLAKYDALVKEQDRKPWSDFETLDPTHAPASEGVIVHREFWWFEIVEQNGEMKIWRIAFSVVP